MKKLQIITFFLFAFVSCKVTQKDELYLNYLSAVENQSTIQYHLVVKLKNANSGEVREICTEGNFLRGALHREYNIEYSEKGHEEVLQLASKNKDRYFEFKNDSAIINLGVENYTMREIRELEKKINFDSIVTKIKEKKTWSIVLDDKQMLMFSHLLFNRGVLTGENNCVGGTLYYINRKKLPF